MKKFKKLLAVVMAMVMILSMMPMVVAYAGGDESEIFVDTPYQAWVGPDGEDLMFTPEHDGWYKFYTEGDYDTSATLYNSDWEEIASNDDTGYVDYNFCLIEKLYAGYTYFLDIDVIDLDEWQTAKFPVYVTETVGVVGAEITKSPDDTTCVEGFEYETIDLTGLEVTFTLSDETTIDWSYDEDKDVIAGFDICYNFDEDGYGHFFYEITCGDAYVIEYLETVENPIESIEVVGDVVIEYYEGSLCMYDEELGAYYYYDNVPYDLKILINYKDGTSEEVYFWDFPFVYTYDTQEEEPWVVGGTYAETICYLGVEVDIPVHIYGCPFVDVTVNQAPKREYVFGDENYGYAYDGDDYIYHLYPFDITGLSFTVEYADGTTQTFDDDDFGIGYAMIDDYPCEIETIACDAPGTYEATLIYKGYAIKYDIKVVGEAPQPEYVAGDADGDGKVTVLDATLIQRMNAGLEDEENVNMDAADIDKEGGVTVIDATLIQRMVAGFEE